MYYDVGGHRELSVWSKEETRHFIQIIKENYARLTGKRERRSAVWLDIARLMSEHVSICQLLMINPFIERMLNTLAFLVILIFKTRFA